MPYIEWNLLADYPDAVKLVTYYANKSLELEESTDKDNKKVITTEQVTHVLKAIINMLNDQQILKNSDKN